MRLPQAVFQRGLRLHKRKLCIRYPLTGFVEMAAAACPSQSAVACATKIVSSVNSPSTTHTKTERSIESWSAIIVVRYKDARGTGFERSFRSRQRDRAQYASDIQSSGGLITIIRHTHSAGTRATTATTGWANSRTIRCLCSRRLHTSYATGATRHCRKMLTWKRCYRWY